MKISYNWLKEYVDVKMTPEKLAELLTMSGLPVESIEMKGSDSLFEIEVTSNRPDCLSVIGIAREVAALTGKKLRVPSCVVRSAFALRASVDKRASCVKKRNTQYTIHNTISIKVKERRLCPRYTGRIIEGVKVAESPRWLKERLEPMGSRPVNNIVDITNFCLFEIGEPLHAFDLDKISGGTVLVRRAAKGEKIRTIDGLERALDETALVIADKEKPIAIAGVMGGLDTEVTSSTKNILLEAAIFDPIAVRRTSRKFGLSTESSYRFERRIDPDGVLFASRRASGLILKEAGGFVTDIIDIGADKIKKKFVTFRHSRLNSVIGLEVPSGKARKMLTSLGFKVKSNSKDVMRLEVPSFRQDINEEIDLIEEVARVLGYDKIPTTLPKVPENLSLAVSLNRTVEDRIRDILTAAGVNEICTYSLLGERDLSSAGLLAQETIEIANPLSVEQKSMRPSLIPGLLKAISWNINRKAKDIALFEIGNIYFKSGAKSFGEAKRLSVGISGSIQGNWQTPSREANFFDLKGMLETLAEGLGLDGVELLNSCVPFLEEGSSAGIKIKGDSPIGFIGEVSKIVLNSYDIKQKVYALEISLEEIIELFKPHTRYTEPPKYPSVVRDLSIIVDKDLECGRVLSLILKTGGTVIKEVELIDRYSGRQIPDGKIGFTYRIEYQDPSKTLEDSRVNSLHSDIFAAIANKLGAKVR